ncbi:MAG: hypothetical protein A3D31_11270 [Candidatus Fluviicola riflensis]|nr:MAG: hypothetical protein CHH17_15695 [Candidatus Fluviicola riflensis]OGS77569.1 MAG: hypothetical protein A3D31_11270 [Candidatus Fluviicola riflensis]OGS84150.1 MAG: hypothetical protein A3E30_12670 [Fluviicola sp. RIFCSPHIGHO2_12_FULL_43_24]OGS84635.1 MAG: hypothetical protein A2724_08205 [Fluviicola sp. RIFCSPHIGHO2_01_FULL_43_53]
MKRSHIILISSLIVLGGLGVFLYFHFRTFKKKLIGIAKDEAKRWVTLSERSAKASNILLDYWKSAGFNFSTSQMQNSSFQNSYPWSSAFISYLFDKAGAKDRFPYASSHSGYFQVAKANRDKKGASLRGFRLDEYIPKEGDLIVYSRQSGKGYDSSGFFPSHGELIIEKGNGYIKAVGGNVSNKVKISTYSTDRKGYLTRKEKDFFMVIQNNIS